MNLWNRTKYCIPNRNDMMVLLLSKKSGNDYTIDLGYWKDGQFYDDRGTVKYRVDCWMMIPNLDDDTDISTVEWGFINKNGVADYLPICSQCGRVISFDRFGEYENYCGNCGRKLVWDGDLYDRK